MKKERGQKDENERMGRRRAKRSRLCILGELNGKRQTTRMFLRLLNNNLQGEGSRKEAFNS